MRMLGYSIATGEREDSDERERRATRERAESTTHAFRKRSYNST